MRGRVIVSFIFGFVAGVVCIAVALYAGGTLRPPSRSLTVAIPNRQPVPDTSAVNVPQKAMTPPDPAPASRAQAKLPPPPDLPAQANLSHGSADREITNEQQQDWQTLGSRHLELPVEGADATRLVNTFEDARDGHPHEALDIMAPAGTSVLAADEGNVVKLFTSKLGGLTVYQFDDSQTWCYYYAHLQRYAKGLKEGTLLRKGERLGYVGSTGDANANAPHLHFAIFKLGPEKHWWKGTAIDPFPLFARQ